MAATRQTQISAIIPTWKRPDLLRKCLRQISACNPSPVEVLVHIDAGDGQTRAMLDAEFGAQVRVFQSRKTQGPGGGRNLLIRNSRSPLVASFDDDSWPVDQDYFARAAELFARLPEAAVIASTVCPRGRALASLGESLTKGNCFEGAACVIHRSRFLETHGYLPLNFAYGMEEADVSLQLLDRGWSIYRTDRLRVFHDTNLEHHLSPEVNAAHITNTALLTFVRYPIVFWGLGLLQVANRVRYSIGAGRWKGILQGLVGIPSSCWHRRHLRAPVSARALRLSRSLARPPAKPCLNVI